MNVAVCGLRTIVNFCCGRTQLKKIKELEQLSSIDTHYTKRSLQKYIEYIITKIHTAPLNGEQTTPMHSKRRGMLDENERHLHGFEALLMAQLRIALILFTIGNRKRVLLCIVRTEAYSSTVVLLVNSKRSQRAGQPVMMFLRHFLCSSLSPT